jgi:tetratricopeptide (TPR) repeat protein
MLERMHSARIQEIVGVNAFFTGATILGRASRWPGVTLLFLLVATFSVSAQNASNADVLRSIESALRAQNYDQALELVHSQLPHAAKDYRLLTLQGIAFSGLGKDRDALTAYHRALAISPDYLAALEGAAQLEYKAGNSRAVPLLHRVLRLRPDDPTSHAMLGVMAYKGHDCATAVRHFHASVQILSSQPTALAEYGSCLMDLERAQDAIPVFQQIAGLVPPAPHSQYNLAVVFLTANRNQEAIDTLQPLLEAKDPDPDVLALASAAYEETGDTPRAVTLLRQAIVADPRKVKYYLDFAAVSLKHSSFQVGVDMLDFGLQQLPNTASLFVARGILYVQQGQYEKGEADFAAANRADPSQTSAGVAQGMALIQASNLDQALATVRTQLKAHPKDYFLYYLKAQVLTQKGADVGSPLFQEAMEDVSRALEIKPDFVLARDLLGSLYVKSGRNDLAVEQCRLALRGNPSDQEALYHLIQALRKSGKDSKNELPELVKRLAVLRQESRETEASNNKYKLFEPPAGEAAAPTSDGTEPK